MCFPPAGSRSRPASAVPALPSAGRAAADRSAPGPAPGVGRGRRRVPSGCVAGSLASCAGAEGSGLDAEMAASIFSGRLLAAAALRSHPPRTALRAAAQVLSPACSCLEGRQEKGRGGQGSEAGRGVTAPPVTLVDSGRPPGSAGGRDDELALVGVALPRPSAGEEPGDPAAAAAPVSAGAAAVSAASSAGAGAHGGRPAAGRGHALEANFVSLGAPRAGGLCQGRPAC